MSFKYNISNLNIDFERTKKCYNEYIPSISTDTIQFQFGHILLAEYALYIYYEDGKIQKNMYQKNLIFNIDYKKIKVESFILFIKTKDGTERVFYTFSPCEYNYDFSNLKIEYNYITKKERNKNLLIVFGSMDANTPIITREFQNGHFDERKYVKLNNMLRFMPFYQKVIDYTHDIIYISDNFSYGSSWYLYEGNREIDNLLAGFLNEFIIKNEYTNISSLGSSKGAFAAINIGNKIEKNVNIFALVPQINLNTYLKSNRAVYPHFSGMVEFKEISENIDKKRIYIFSGKNDDQYAEQKEYSKVNKCKFIDLGDEYKTHNDLIFQNYERIFNSIFGKNGILND